MEKKMGEADINLGKATVHPKKKHSQKNHRGNLRKGGRFKLLNVGTDGTGNH